LSDTKPDSKDAFFSVLRELETQHTQCSSKAKFIDNVVSGREQVTFSVIDRCREAALQIRQAAHVFRTTQERLPADPSGADASARIKTLREEVDAVADTVGKNLVEIVSWVPAAVNSRATSTVGFAR
jgi:hypothetical protein